MAAPAISAVSRFQRASNSHVILMDRIASTSGVPTRGEINAGLDITGDLFNMDGWTREAGFQDVPDWGSLETGQIPARSAAASGTLVMYADIDGDDISAEVDEGDLKTVAVFRNGDVPGDPCTVFNVIVGGVNETFDGDSPTYVNVACAIAKRWTGITIPA